MNPLPIDKNIPLPARFPFAGMKVGDSFAVPADVQRATVAVAASRYGRKHKMKFSTRKMEDGSYRCWRME